MPGVLVDMEVLNDPAAREWCILHSKRIAGELAIVNPFLWSGRRAIPDLSIQRSGVAAWKVHGLGGSASRVSYWLWHNWQITRQWAMNGRGK